MLSVPTNRVRAVLSGIRTSSSGLWKPLPPLACMIPITRNGYPPMVISEPIAEAPSPRLSAVVAPRTATRSVLSSLAWFRNEPCHMS